MEYLLIPLFAILNRARGSNLFGRTSSTTIGRVVSMFGMALITGFAAFNGNWFRFDVTVLFSFAALMFWCVWAWDYLWSAEIGSPGATKGFPPVDWIMSKLWGLPPVAVTGQLNMTSRIWGLIAMGLRMTLAAPFFIGLAFLSGHPENAYIAAFTPLLAVPYFIFGLLFHYWPKFDAYTISLSELSVGAMLGVFTLATMGIL